MRAVHLHTGLTHLGLTLVYKRQAILSNYRAMKKSKTKTYLIVFFELSLSLIFSAMYFIYVADTVADHSNYFIAIAVLPIVFGALVGWFWYLVNSQLILSNEIRPYQLIMIHVAACLTPTLFYLLIMSASG